MENCLLFIDAITEGLETGNWTDLIIKMKILCVIWCAVFAAVVIDFITGVRKSKRNGEFSGSEGVRRSVPKFLQYCGVLTFGFLFDVIISAYGVHIQAGTAIMAIILIGIEFYSAFYENSDDKLQKRIRREAGTAATLLKHKDDILTGIAEVIETKFKDTKITDNDSTHNTQGNKEQ